MVLNCFLNSWRMIRQFQHTWSYRSNVAIWVWNPGLWKPRWHWSCIPEFFNTYLNLKTVLHILHKIYVCIKLYKQYQWQWLYSHRLIKSTVFRQINLKMNTATSIKYRHSWQKNNNKEMSKGHQLTRRTSSFYKFTYFYQYFWYFLHE